MQARLLSLLVLGPTLAGCAVSVTEPLALEVPIGHRIAVLPPSGGNLTRTERIGLRRIMASVLSARGYVPLSHVIVDHHLERAGHRPWEVAWTPSNPDLARIGAGVGADSVLAFEHFEDSSVALGVVFERDLDGALRVVDVARGADIWEIDVTTREFGGVLFEPTVLNAIRHTIDSLVEPVVALLGLRAAVVFLERLPPDVRGEHPHRRPVVERVEATSSSGTRTLRGGDRLEVRATAPPDGAVVVSLADSLLRYPMVETAPGTYSATILVDRDAPPSAGPVRVVAYDRFGVVSRPADAPGTWVVEGTSR